MTQFFGQRKAPKAPYVALMLGWLIWGEGQPIVQRVREWITHLLHAWERKLEAGKQVRLLIPIRPSILQELFQLSLYSFSMCFQICLFLSKSKKISRLWRINNAGLDCRSKQESSLYWCAWKDKDRCELKKEFYPPPSIFYNTMWNDHSQKVFQRPSFPNLFFFFFFACGNQQMYRRTWTLYQWTPFP